MFWVVSFSMHNFLIENVSVLVVRHKTLCASKLLMYILQHVRCDFMYTQKDEQINML